MTKKKNKSKYFIAEIGVNHGADLKTAYNCIKLAKEGGANAIKLQCYKANKLASNLAGSYWDKKVEAENSQLTLYKKLDGFGEYEYDQIYKYCKKIKIDFIVTPFDIDSISFFKNKVKFFKISSSDITNFPLIKKIADTKKSVIISTGASNKKEIGNALRILKQKCKKIILLHCILNYPTKIENANLNMIDDLKTFGYEVGISDHTLPKDSMTALSYAYIKGVKYIEKHFTHNKRLKGNDHFHSFDKNDLIKFNKKIAKIDSVLGSNTRTVLKSEIVSRRNARRSIFFNTNLKKNTILQKKHFIMLRPNIGMQPKDITIVVGKKLLKNKKKGEILKKNDFK